jgi:hypothetical protein
MRRKLFGLFLALSAIALFVPVPVLADDMKHEGDAPEITVHGELRARWEYLDNYSDFDSDDTANDSFDYTPYRAVLGVDALFGTRVAAHVQFQATGAFGDGGLNPSDDPTAQNDITSTVALYQANVDIKNVGSENSSLRIGRQEHTLGNELHMGDNDFYNGFSFDGIRWMYDAEKWDLNAFWYTLEEENVISTGPINGGSDDQTFSGITFGFDIGDDGQKVEPYALLFHDGFPGAEAAFWTIGALYNRRPSQDHSMDWSAEFALQTGNVGSGVAEQDVKGSVFEGWFGYSWGDSSRHRVHVGVLLLSDGDSTTEVEAFIPLNPDTHAYNRLGDMDLFVTDANNSAIQLSCSGGVGNTFHNVTNWNVGYDWTSGMHHFGASYHKFDATEDFGVCDGDYGAEVDLNYDYDLTHNLAFQVGLANFMPGDEFAPVDDSAMRGWAQARLRF